MDAERTLVAKPNAAGDGRQWDGAAEVLLLADAEIDALVIAGLVEAEGRRVARFRRDADVVASLAAGARDVVLVDLDDLDLPGGTIDRLHRACRAHDPAVPLVGLRTPGYAAATPAHADELLDALLDKPLDRKVFGAFVHGLARRTGDRSEVDLALLRQHAEDLGLDRLGRLVAAFHTSSADLLGTLRGALAEGRWDDVAAAAHAVKSAANAMGLRGLACRALVVETSPRREHVEDLAAAHAEASERLDRAYRSLLEGGDGNGPAAVWRDDR